MDSSTIVKNLHKALKELGHEMPLGHMYEAIAKASGHKSYNVAKANPKGLDPVISTITQKPAISTMEPQIIEPMREAEDKVRKMMNFMEGELSAGRLDKLDANGVMGLVWDHMDLGGFDPDPDALMYAAYVIVRESSEMSYVSKKIEERVGVSIIKEVQSLGYTFEDDIAMDLPQSGVAQFEVKVVARAEGGRDEIEIKKYYKVFARNGIEAKLIVDDYVRNRIEEEDDYKFDQSKRLAELETVGSFWGSNWEVIWNSTTPVVKDVYGKPESELHNRYFVKSKADNTEAEVTFINGRFIVHPKGKKEVSYDTLEAIYKDFYLESPKK